MKKEEARRELEICNDEITTYKTAIADRVNRIAELEEIINKKDDWRDREINEDEYVLLTNKVMLMYQMHAFAHVKNEGWEPDWEDVHKRKFGILYNAYGGFEVGSRGWCNYFVFGVAVKSQEIALEMFKEFGERIEEIYNKQY